MSYDSILVIKPSSLGDVVSHFAGGGGDSRCASEGEDHLGDESGVQRRCCGEIPT